MTVHVGYMIVSFLIGVVIAAGVWLTAIHFIHNGK